MCVRTCMCVPRVRMGRCARTYTHTPDYGLGKQGEVIRFLEEANTFRIYKTSRPALGHTQLPIQLVTE